MSEKFGYQPSGFVQRVTDFTYKIPDFDPRTGDHYWTVITSYNVDPVIYLKGESHLDKENLVAVSPPCCIHCELAYTPLLATRRCKGEG